MILKNVMWILFIILISEVFCDKSEDAKDEDVFVPTHKWQVVRQGQMIPKGLHVRVNFETGVTEAKLLDEENDKDNKKHAVLQIPQENEEDEIKIDVIKESLQKIKGDDILKVYEVKVKEKFRNYKHIKEELGSLNLTPKIDAEVLKDLLKQHDEEIKKEKINAFAIARILEDFDFLAHQFDNAVEFVNQNGFTEIIYKNLNLSSSQIRQETLKLFGSLVQNNPRVQVYALETGSISVLLRILNLEQSVQVKSRAIFALGSLLRRFPFSQIRFVENGGLSVISKMLEKDPIKIQIKLVTLINDLLTENFAIKDQPNVIFLNLESLLLEQDWCEYLNKLLYSLVVTDSEDHDSLEKCILAMHTIASKCAAHYNKEILVSLQQKYQALALNELDKSDEFSNSDFFTNLQNLCGEILHNKNIKTEL